MSEIAPVSKISEMYRDRQAFVEIFQDPDPVDSKIREIVLSQLTKSAPGTLLASATSPRVVIDQISGIIPSDDSMEKRKGKKSMRDKKGMPHDVAERKQNHGHIPIGLSRCERYLPLNALLQLLLFLPNFQEIFSFVPKSFQFFSRFIEQYVLDQREKLPIAGIDTNHLLHQLMLQMPLCFSSHFFSNSLSEFYYELVRVMFGKNTSLGNSSIAFHPEWHVHWDVNFPFSFCIDIPSRPPEIFVTPKNRPESGSCYLFCRQFFTKPDSHCYDLDAFIECRPDRERKQYIAYLKVLGSWYQCDDEKISTLRSTLLNLPLSRSVLLHYRRIWP